MADHRGRLWVRSPVIWQAVGRNQPAAAAFVRSEPNALEKLRADFIALAPLNPSTTPR